MRMEGKKIYLRILSPEDVSQDYVDWMHDPLVNQYLESKYTAQTVDMVKEFVEAMNSSAHDFLFGIFLRDGKHVGNIKIGGVNFVHRYAEIGLLIGDRDQWGKGLGREAIELATRYAFEELNLNKVEAGIYANNVGSYKAFIKAGYREVGMFKRHRWSHGKYVDEYIMEKLNGE